MKKVENVAEIDAKIDAAKDGTLAERVRVGHDLIVALKEATGTRSLVELADVGGDVLRLRNRCLSELLDIPLHNFPPSHQTA